MHSNRARFRPAMSELRVIESLAGQVASRRRIQKGWTGLWWGFFIGCSIYLTVLGVYKMAPIPYFWVAVAGLVSLAALPIGFFVGWSRPVSRVQSARWLDAHEGLQERLGTALEVGKSQPGSRWSQL